MLMFVLVDYTGIDIQEERKENMPNREWKMARHRVPWYKGDTIFFFQAEDGIRDAQESRGLGMCIRDSS